MPTFTITPEGRKKMVDLDVFTRDEFAILDVLFSLKAPVEFDELSAETGLDDDELRHHLERLLRKGNVKAVAGTFVPLER